jgi:hypothetical protein
MAMTGSLGPNASCRQPSQYPSTDRLVCDHFHRLANRIAAVDAERTQQVGLIQYRVPRRQIGGSPDDMRLHPGTSGNRVADAHRRTASPRPECRARSAVKIERDVEVPPAKPLRHREVIAQRATPDRFGITRSSLMWRVSGDHRGGRRLYDVAICGGLGIGGEAREGSAW